MSTPSFDLVSVVIPVYNAEAFLEETLLSVINQTYPNIEIVAVDDGSKDGSIAILEKYKEHVRIIKQPNSGAATARNKGVQEARGEWIAFVDADDIWDLNKIEKQMKLSNDYQWSYTDTVFVGGVNDGHRDSDFTKKYLGDVFENIVCSNFVSTSTVLINRDVFMEAGGFDTSIYSVEDWDLWIRVAAKYPLGYINEPLVKYRIHSSSTSRSTRRTIPHHMNVISRTFSPGGVGERVKHLMPVARSNSLTICSLIAEEEGDYIFALQCAVKAARFQPNKPYYWKRVIKNLAKTPLILFR